MNFVAELMSDLRFAVCEILVCRFCLPEESFVIVYLRVQQGKPPDRGHVQARVTMGCRCSRC